MLFDLRGPDILTSKQKSRIRKSIALIQVCGSLTIIFILFTSSSAVLSIK
jgi:hypothetical protein